MKVLKFLSILALMTTVSICHAHELNTNEEGIALHGYDPVAYVLNETPTMGDSAFTTSYEGATYQFASQDNLNLFLGDPNRFAPEYGGYCSYGVRVGKKFDVDPSAFSVVNDRLFMLLNEGTHAIWLQDRDKNIEIADRLWPSIRNVPEDQLTDPE